MSEVVDVVFRKDRYLRARFLSNGKYNSGAQGTPSVVTDLEHHDHDQRSMPR